MVVHGLAERRATWFELLFDLVFVAAVSQATHRMALHPSWLELLATVGLFVPIWWTWVVYTYQANRFAEIEDGAHRVTTLAGMFGICLVAVALPTVGRGNRGDILFVVGYLVARYVPVALYLLAARHRPAARAIAARYATGSTVAALLWVSGLFLASGGARTAVWVVAMAVELALPFAAKRSTGAVSHHLEHLRERFGLFTIIVIGESLLAVVTGLDGPRTGVAGGLTAAFGFVVTAALWWSYFRTADSRDELTAFPRASLRHAFTYGHLPAQLGLAVAGASTSVAIAHAPDPLHGPTAAAVFGGVAAFLVAVAAVQWAFQRTVDRVTALRLGGAGVVVLLGVLSVLLHLPSPVALGLLAVAAVLISTAPGLVRRPAAAGGEAGVKLQATGAVA